MAEGCETENPPPKTEGQAIATDLGIQWRGDRSKKVTPVLEEEDLANQPLPVKHREKQFIPGRIVYPTEEDACQMTYDQLPKEPGTGVIIILDLNPDHSGRYVAVEHYSQEPLGKGSGGETFLCRDNRSGKKFVEKRIEFHKEQFNLKEVTILLRARHENIIKFYGVIIDKKDNREIVVRILMEYGGTLLKKYVEEKKPSEIDKLKLLVQLSTVLAFLHDSGIIHNDVHPLNVVIRTDGDREHLKLIDFGEAMTSKESFNGKVPVPLAMMEEAFSFGETVLYCYTGQFMVDDPKFDIVPADIVRIIETLTNSDLGKRMSVKEAKKHLKEILKERQLAAESPDEDLPVPANLVPSHMSPEQCQVSKKKMETVDYKRNDASQGKNVSPRSSKTTSDDRDFVRGELDGD